MDSQKLREIVDIFKDADIGKMKLETEEFTLLLEKDVCYSTPQKLVPQDSRAVQISEVTDTVAKSETPKQNGDYILSPMVGTFYRASSPTSQPFVNVGDRVKKDKPMAIIEAMKIMNEIPAEFDCKIIEILVEDGQPVEFNTPLFSVEKL